MTDIYVYRKKSDNTIEISLPTGSYSKYNTTNYELLGKLDVMPLDKPE